MAMSKLELPPIKVKLPRRRVKTPPPFCLNCGLPVELSYCPGCGQENLPDAVSMSEVWHDFIDEFVKLDGKLLRTLFTLLFKPGVLTVEYVAGRRIRYLSPFKMYLVVSALFFLVFTRFGGMGNVFNSDSSDDKPASAKTETAKKKPGALTLKTDAKKKGDEIGDLQHGTLLSMNEGSVQLLNEKVRIADLPKTVSDYEQRQRELPLAKRDSRLKKYLSTKMIDIKSDPTAAIRNLLASFLPNLAFCALPFAALLLKMLYVRQKRFYIEHLVFVLHLQTFYFAVGAVVLLANNRLPEEWSNLVDILNLLLGIVYSIVALHRVYGQTWGATIGKAFLFANLHGLFLIFAAVIAFLITLVQNI